MRRTLGAAALVVASSGILGCFPEPTTLDLRFQTARHFLYSDAAQLAMFDLEEGETGVCSTLIASVRDELGTREPTIQLTVPVCDLRNGGTTFDDIGAGRRAFVAVVRNEYGVPLLTGCREVDTFVDAPDVVLNLAQTDVYTRETEGVELNCRTIDEKCRGGC